MSIVLTRAYRTVFKEYATSLGFKQKGSLFIKKVGDEIIQTIYLFKGSTPVEFTLNIGIFPFCTKVDKILLKEGNFRLEDFLENHFDWWEYNRFDYNSTIAVVREVLEIFQEKIFPILNKITDLNSYLEFLTDYEFKKYGEILWSDDKLYIYLKIGDFEKALSIIESFEKHNIEVAEANKILYDKEEEYEKYLSILKEDLTPLIEIRNAIKQNKKDLINAVIKNNEDNTRKILKEYGIKF